MVARLAGFLPRLNPQAMNAHVVTKLTKLKMVTKGLLDPAGLCLLRVPQFDALSLRLALSCIAPSPCLYSGGYSWTYTISC